ncbi:MAG: type I-E CRISPR-associated endoribonuclease Cas2e, partial [Propioniciclava sp.]
MVVLVVTAVPAGLRGFVTRWLLEIAPGVFVGRVSKRVREALWLRILELCKDGRAILVFQSDNEQKLDFLVHRHDWEVAQVDGLSLIRRPLAPTETNPMR